MKYQSGSSFRRALETRLRNLSLETGMPLVRLRKMVAFDRFLARLMETDPQHWILKGGFALQLRLGERSRTTKDIDFLYVKGRQDTWEPLRNAGNRDIGDWFIFEIGQPEGEMPGNVGGIRHRVQSLLDGRIFENFHIDVGIGTPVIEPVDYLVTPDLLAFAGIEPVRIPCYPISQQIAEKIHAYTRTYASGESSRIKDFIDLLLLAELGPLSGLSMMQAIEATFQLQEIQDVPFKFPTPPSKWDQGYRRNAKEVGLSESTLEGTFRALQSFLDPVLDGSVLNMTWHPENWAWVDDLG